MNGIICVHKYSFCTVHAVIENRIICDFTHACVVSVLVHDLELFLLYLSTNYYLYGCYTAKPFHFEISVYVE